MSRKYEVPSLRKSDEILKLISTYPNQLKLIDISHRLAIHKSSMFSLLKTMEEMNWVERELGDTYRLGSAFAVFGGAFFRQFDLISLFHREAVSMKQLLNESIQLGKLEGNEVLYLAKEEADSPVKLVSEPGMKFPAHATALGKALLSELDPEQVVKLYQDEVLLGLTSQTIRNRERLIEVLADVLLQGYATDLQECVIGFQCVGVPVRKRSGIIVAAVSCSMPVHHWEAKHLQVIEEMKRLASKLSILA